MNSKKLAILLGLFFALIVSSLYGCDDTTIENTSSESSAQQNTAESELEIQNSNEIIVVESSKDTKEPASVELKEAYQIRNIKYDLLLRPKDAKKTDGNPIVLYNQYPWKCLSWKLDKGENDTYRLVNFFTSKTIEPIQKKTGDTVVVQQMSLGSQKNAKQYWKFVKLPNGFYQIISAQTNQSLTAGGQGRDTVVYLSDYESKDEQKWELMDLPELTM